MPRVIRISCAVLVLVLHATAGCLAQTPLTWQEVRTRFEAANPTLKAGQIGVDESRAEEVTAYLRPNPIFSVSTDGTQLLPYHGVWQPFVGTQYSTNFSYLHEREHKRELRLQSAQGATTIAVSQQQDLDRNLLFNLRGAFVQVLQAKAVLGLARSNLEFFDQELAISRDRYNSGDIARVDLDRIQLQRVQYEADYETAQVNLRTAKIQLLQLMDDRSPVDSFDVIGPFIFSDQVMSLDDFRNIALSTRPDLRAAAQSIDKARIDHQLAVANGSTDPTFSVWWTHNPSFNNPSDNDTVGASISIPLRVFDRNQGEKERTLLDIGRSERLRDANQALVLSDVESAYATLVSALNLLRPYRDKYLGTATTVRDTISYAYQHGGAALVDFLDAQRDYRAVQLAYITLIGSYLTAAAQMNLAVGREVM